MWLPLEDYLKKINSDSRKYFDLDRNILEITPEILPLNFKTLFKNGNTVIKFEIGFGNGDSLIRLARQNPDINYFGIDRKMDRIRTALRKLNKNDAIPNLIIARLDTGYIPEVIGQGVFDEVIMNFPDPWPKKKHHKNRTVNAEFINTVHGILKPGGIFRFSSDHTEYSFEVIDILLRSEMFENEYAPSHYRKEVGNRIETQFEMHKKREGYVIHHLKFRKV